VKKLLRTILHALGRHFYRKLRTVSNYDELGRYTMEVYECEMCPQAFDYFLEEKFKLYYKHTGSTALYTELSSTK